MKLITCLLAAFTAADALVVSPPRTPPRYRTFSMTAGQEPQHVPSFLRDPVGSRRGFGAAVATGVVAAALGLPSPAQAGGNAELIGELGTTTTTTSSPVSPHSMASPSLTRPRHDDFTTTFTKRR